jgi:uncharacterized lipoprotein YajG
MKNKILSIIIIAAFFIVASCKKTEPTVSAYPTLTITSPHSSGDMFTVGQTIHIMGTAVASASDDSHLLHELSLTLKNSSNTVVWKADIGVHDLMNYTIDTTLTAPAAGTYMLYDSLVNHLDNYATSSQSFMTM